MMDEEDENENQKEAGDILKEKTEHKALKVDPMRKRQG
jgi:hypothetical protein